MESLDIQSRRLLTDAQSEILVAVVLEKFGTNQLKVKVYTFTFIAAGFRLKAPRAGDCTMTSHTDLPNQPSSDAAEAMIDAAA